MYFEAPVLGEKLIPPPAAIAVVAIGIIGVVVFGLYPEPILQFASRIPISYAILAP